MRLRGYTLPQTPTGRSSLVAPPPWHYAGELLVAEFRADPAVVRGLLPAAFDLERVDGRCAAVFADWQSCSSSGGEQRDPCRAQYREFYVAAAAEIAGEPVARCPFCWVDRDFALVRGLIQGYPKKLGSIWITRACAVGRAAPRLEAGARFSASLAANDRRLAELTVTLEAPRVEPPPLFSAPLVHTRLLPPWGEDSRAVEELVRATSEASEHADVWEGRATLAFAASPADELAALEPLEIGRGYRFSFAETVTGGRTVGA